MAVEDLEDFEPIQIESSVPDKANRKHLFSIDGRDYYVATEVPFRVTLKATRIYANGSAAQAEAYVMTQFLGDEAYEALCESSVTEDQFDKIVELAAKVVMGKGKEKRAEKLASPRGRKKLAGS